MRMYPSTAFGSVDSVVATIVSLRADDISFAENLAQRLSEIERLRSETNAFTAFYLQSPDATMWRIEIDNTGTLTTTAV